MRLVPSYFAICFYVFLNCLSTSFMYYPTIYQLVLCTTQLFINCLSTSFIYLFYIFLIMLYIHDKLFYIRLSTSIFLYMYIYIFIFFIYQLLFFYFNFFYIFPISIFQYLFFILFNKNFCRKNYQFSKNIFINFYFL